MLESFHQRKREITAKIAELATLSTRIGARSLAARVETDLVKKLEADRFNLVVVGEFNHGKTTFVNALLGRELLPVGVTPTTAVIHHLEYGEQASAEVVRVSGATEALAVEDVKKFCVSGSAAAESDEVRYVSVFVPAPLLEERIVLVDTPGVNDLSLTRADITYSYIPKSDAVLFLLDAGQPLKESERVFLQDKLLAQSRNKIIFVVTKRDIWDAAEQIEALAYIRAELDKILPGAPIFAVSAQQALDGSPESSGLPELKTHLMAFLAEERGRILLDNALGQALGLARLLGKGIDARKRAVQMTTDELARRIEILEADLAGQSKTLDQRRAFIREEVAGIRAWVRRDMEHFTEDVLKQLPALIDDAKTDEIKQHLGPFLERTFVDWAQKETKELAVSLEALAEKTIALVREDANDSAKRLSEAFGGDIKSPNVEVPTLGYDVGVTALMVVGLGVFFTNWILGGALAAAALPLAWYLRGRVEKQTREKARELAPVAIREAAGKLGAKLDEMISTFADRLDAWVVSAGVELHRELLEILRQAKGEREAGSTEAAQLAKTCDEHLQQLGLAEQGLTALREALTTRDAAAAPVPVGSGATAASDVPDTTQPALGVG